MKDKRIGHFSSDLTDIASKHDKEYPETHGLLDSLSEAGDYLASLPREYIFEFDQDLSPSMLGTTVAETTYNLLDNLQAWLGFLAYSSAFRIRNLVSNVIEGLNNKDHFLTLNSARGLLEHIADIHSHHAVMTERRTELWNTSDFPDRIGATARYIGEITSRVRKGRLDWTDYWESEGTAKGKIRELDKTHPDFQRTILSDIDKLGKVLPKIRSHYNVLCEFVHPNLGAQMLLWGPGEDIGSNRRRIKVSERQAHESNVAFTIHLLAPWVGPSLRLSVREIEEIRSWRFEVQRWQRTIPPISEQ